MSPAKSHHVRPNSKSVELLHAEHSLTDDATKRALQDIESKIVQLGHLAGQLGGFVGQSESVKKAVENAIIAVFDNNPHLKNDLKDVYSPLVTKLSESVKSAVKPVDTGVIGQLKSKVASQITETERQIEKLKPTENNLPSSPSPSADPDKLQSKLEALRKVKELCDFHDKVSKSPNDPKNILNNLCSGLEKFLGFNPESKGYDGSGIVYSDLDRLCDGVMGFLKGVLESVKNENEVTTYDKHITPDENRLEKVLSKLQSSIGTGRAGLVDSVDAVREWLEKYWQEVDKLNINVTRDIKSLSDDITGKHIKSIENEQTNGLHAMYMAFQSSATDLVGRMKMIKDNKNRYDGLDSALKDKLSTPVGRIDGALEVLTKSSGNALLADQVKHVDRTLKEQQNQLQWRLSEEFANIRSNVLSLKDTKNDQFRYLEKTLRAAEELVGRFDADCRDQVIRQFYDIQNDVTKVYNNLVNKQTELKELVSEMQKKLMTLSDQFEYKVKEGVRDDLTTLRTGISGLNHQVDISNAKNGKIISKQLADLAIYKEALDEAYHTAEEPSTQLKHTYSGSSEKFHEKFVDLTKQVSKLKMDTIKVQLKVLAGRVEGQLGTLKGLAGSVKGVVDETLTDVNATLGPSIDRLQKGINEQLGSYVTREIQSAMKAIKTADLSSISDDTKWPGFKILQTVSALTGVLADADDNLKQNIEIALDDIKDSSDSNEWPEGDTNPVIKAIKAQLSLKVDGAKDSIDKFATEAAKKGTDRFEAALQTKIIGTDNNGIHGKILAEMEKLKGPFTHEKTQFQTAFKLFDDALANVKAASSAAGQTEKNVQRLVEELNKAVAGLTMVISTFDNSAQHQIREAAKTVIKDAVHKVTTEIQLFAAGTGDGTEKLKTALAALRLQFNELNTFMDVEGSGKVDTKINEIQSEVIQKLGDIKKVKDEPRNNDDGEIVIRRNEADNLLNDLRTKLQERLRDMRFAVEISNGNLTKAIDDVLNVVENSRQAAKQAVQSAFTQVTYQVRNLFAENCKSDLQALQQLINVQLENVKDIINTDMNKGVKGLLRNLSDFVISKLRSPPITKNTKMGDLAENVREGIYDFIGDVMNQTDMFGDDISKLKKAGPKDEEIEKQLPPMLQTMMSISDAIDTLLSNLGNSKHFDHDFATHLDALKNILATFTPKEFGDNSSPIFQPLKEGFDGLVAQLGKAYVNSYDGGQKIIKWTENDVDKTVLTPAGKNGAKVFISLLEILSHDINWLKDECEGQWNKRNICLEDTNGNRNDLGLCLKRFGYGVPSREGVQDNELRCSKYANGHEIFASLTQLTYTQKDEHNVITNLSRLADCLSLYYQVCHVPTPSSKKHPSSVYDMLEWLCGLPHNRVHDELVFSGFGELFDKPEETAPEDIDVEGPAVSDLNEQCLVTYREKITVGSLSDALTAVCSQAHSVLTAILGHGHAAGRYACDFNTNPDGFVYPTDLNTLICMLFDIINRLHHQLYFLYEQCCYSTKLGGWSDCWYGRDVAGSSWRCNNLQCPDQKSNQNHNQTCDQKCTQKAECGLKSPLQSFLEDGLAGFLPHPVKSEKGKLTCSVKNHFSLPCKTPMGFTDISDTASHRETGKHIRDALFDVCSNEWSAFSRFCSLLNCLLSSAPKTLDESFGFYYGLVNGWNKNAKQAFEQSVKDANFGDPKTTLDITALFKSSSHNISQSMTHPKGDLYSLVECGDNASSTPSYPCGPYVRPLCHYTYNIFAEKHNDKYVSWIVFLTGTFHELLQQMYDECSKNCDSSGSKCSTSRCDASCVSYNAQMPANYKHNEGCSSIANCKFMRPTFFKYGLVHNDVRTLARITSKRTCKDFCTALKIVVNKEEKPEHALAMFVYRTIPQFLWDIRGKFFWTNVALWLLSLLYLIHIMVIRVDLLHIKSHLHSPSSHRIAAQSLLAAGRVNKLGRVFYLQS